MNQYRTFVLLILCFFTWHNPAAKTIKVMTWNIQMGLGYHYIPFWESGYNIPGVPEIKNNIKNIAKLINTYDPDIVMLQEVSDGSFVPRTTHLIGELTDRLPAYHYSSIPYWETKIPVFCRSMSGAMDYHLLILSKTPQDGHGSRTLEQQMELRSWHRFIPCLFPVRKLLCVGLKIDDQLLYVITTHLESLDDNGQTRIAQFESLKQHLNNLTATGAPWIMGGDLNMVPPVSPLMIRNQQRFHLNFSGLNNYSVYPNPKESQQSAHYTAHECTQGEHVALEMTLDYIMVNNSRLKIVKQKIITDARLSDHCPVMVTLETIDN